MQTALSEPIHRTRHRVIYADTDAGGVVYYGNYLRYFEIGRTEFMRELVVSYRAIEELGLILPVIESYTRYKASARYDDLLLIETSLAELKSVSCRFHYRISRLDETGDSAPQLLAKGFTVNASVNRDGKLTRLPAEVLERMRPLAPAS